MVDFIMTPTVRNGRLGSCERGLGSELWKFNICSSCLCIVFFCALSVTVSSPPPPSCYTPDYDNLPYKESLFLFHWRFLLFNFSWMSFTGLPSDTLFCWYLTSILSYVYVWKDSVEAIYRLTTSLSPYLCNKVFLKAPLLFAHFRTMSVSLIISLHETYV